MKRTVFLLMVLATTFAATAQSPYKGTFYNQQLNIRARLDLEAKDIPVPGMEELDSCYGYLQGNLNGTWFVLRVKSKNEKKAVVRASCDRGDNAQDLEIQLTEDGISLRQVGNTYIKGVANRKYVKLPKAIVLKRED